MSAPIVVIVRQNPSATISPVQKPAVSVTTLKGGERGPAGADGPPGAGSVEYIQSVPASNWAIVHNLGRRPCGYIVYDALDNEVETGMRVVDLNTIEITMASAMAGRVVLA